MNGLAVAAMREPLRVKFLSKTHEDDISSLWSPLIPGKGFEGVDFTFDANDQDYDFLAVYEGLPKWEKRKPSQRFESLACSHANSLLITTEPSSIRIDGPQFMRQFGHVVTSKSRTLTRHPNHITATPPLRWFYGRNLDKKTNHLSVDQISSTMPAKTKEISTVCSTKRRPHTVHAARLGFIIQLRDHLPELDVYGRGIKPISDKMEAMQTYRYHIAIENHVEPGHWTEKLADCFLAGCLPFYFGDPDYAKIFPDDSVIPIDIFDLESAVATIRNAINTQAFEHRQSALLEARRIVLEQYNTLGWVARFAANHFDPGFAGHRKRIHNRHAFRRNHPIRAMSDLSFRTRMHFHPSAHPLQRPPTSEP